MAYVLQIIKEKFAQVWKFFGPQLGGRGPTFLNPISGFQRNKHICIKNLSYFKDLWGQILMFEGQIRCIGPHEPLGPKIENQGP
jgi:hypothetical protein